MPDLSKLFRGVLAGQRLKRFHVCEEQSSGTRGGTNTTGYQTRTLNKIKINEINGATLASNQVTVPAGKYIIWGRAPLVGVNNHKLKLRNITDSLDAIYGEQNYSSNSYVISNEDHICGELELAVATTFELWHYTQTSKTDNGYGEGVSQGTEVYSELIFFKIEDGIISGTELLDYQTSISKYYKDLYVTCSSSTQVVINTGSSVAMDDGTEIVTVGSNITVDITSSGANGLDTGSEASDTWYYIWLISNGSTVSGLLSASSTNPTLPAGYSKKRLIGAVRNNSSSNFKQFTQFNKRVQYLDSETIYAAHSISWVAIDCTSFVPANSHIITCGWMSQSTTSGSAHYVFVAPGTKSGTGSGGVYIAGVGGSPTSTQSLTVSDALLDSSRVFSIYGSNTTNAEFAYSFGFVLDL